MWLVATVSDSAAEIGSHGGGSRQRYILTEARRVTEEDWNLNVHQQGASQGNYSPSR